MEEDQSEASQSLELRMSAIIINSYAQLIIEQYRIIESAYTYIMMSSLIQPIMQLITFTAEFKAILYRQVLLTEAPTSSQIIQKLGQ